MFEIIEPNWLDMESKILERKVDKPDLLNAEHLTKGEQITVDDLLGMYL